MARWNVSLHKSIKKGQCLVFNVESCVLRES